MPKDELPSLDDFTENPVELPSVDEFITEEEVVEDLPSVDEYVVDIEEKVIYEKPNLPSIEDRPIDDLLPRIDDYIEEIEEEVVEEKKGKYDNNNGKDEKCDHVPCKDKTNEEMELDEAGCGSYKRDDKVKEDLDEGFLNMLKHGFDPGKAAHAKRVEKAKKSAAQRASARANLKALSDEYHSLIKTIPRDSPLMQQISALGGFTLQPTPARSIGGTRHAHFYAQHRPFAIVTSMAQIHSFFDVRAIPPRGGFLRSARGARFHS